MQFEDLMGMLDDEETIEDISKIIKRLVEKSVPILKELGGLKELFEGWIMWRAQIKAEIIEMYLYYPKLNFTIEQAILLAIDDSLALEKALSNTKLNINKR